MAAKSFVWVIFAIIMRRFLAISVIVLSFFTGCGKEGGSKSSGTTTIYNTLYGTGPYYALGFSFSLGREVSTLGNPKPDITLIADEDIDGTIRRLLLQTENFKNSFYRYGQYSDAAEASAAFRNLVSASVPAWEESGENIAANQIWIFRTGSEHYAKFRIINTVAEKRNGKAYAECTFEWVYQPDGTLTFPAE